MRLIDADNLISVLDILSDKGGDIRYWEQLKMIVADCPTADVVKHGRWLYEGKRGRFPVCRCSVCGNEENADWAVLGGNVNYCPNCGALMVNDEVEE